MSFILIFFRRGKLLEFIICTCIIIFLIWVCYVVKRPKVEGEPVRRTSQTSTQDPNQSVQLSYTYDYYTSTSNYKFKPAYSQANPSEIYAKASQLYAPENTKMVIEERRNSGKGINPYNPYANSYTMMKPTPSAPAPDE